MPIELRIGEEAPEYEGGIYGLLITIVVIILVIVVYYAIREMQLHYEIKRERELDLQVQKVM